VKPSHSILPLALVCALLSTGVAHAAERNEIQLAQANQGDKDKDDKNDKKDRKDKKDNKDGNDKKNDGGKKDDKNRGGASYDRFRGSDKPDKKDRDDKASDKRPKGTPRRDEEKKAQDTKPPQKVDLPKSDDKGRGGDDKKGGGWDKGRGGDDKKGSPFGAKDPDRKDNNGNDRKDADRKDDKGKDNNRKDDNNKDAGRKDDKGKDNDRKGDNNKDAGRKDTYGYDAYRKDNNKDAGRKDNDGKDRDRKDAGDKDKDRKDGDRRGRWTGGKRPEPTEARDIKDLKTKRKERSEDGGKRIVIEEPDKRRIIREGGRTIIRHDETERFRRIAPNTRREKRNGLDISVTLLPGGIQIFTDFDNDGRPLRRYRRDRDGRDVVLFDNRDYYRRSRGGSFFDAIVDLPPPRLRIPRERYIVEYEGASDDDIYDTLDAGPVDDIDRGYSLEEVRYSPMLRDRMRRIDLDTVNFEFGSWTVEGSQYGALERVARAMNRIIDRNPGEMFLIEGHTDAVGSDDDNLSLSDRRAESVAIILTEEFGVPPENLTTQGYGEQYLKVPTDGPERLNRRVAVRKITPLLAR
jgi:outer membrane protein OmpA-like peptidoglycan-associated protein